jgi:LmbE family N-acetylglucosaminyl deacetylase
MKRTILVIAAHPDDEVLGVGGTIAVHAAAGDEVQVLILAEGLTSREIIRNRSGKTEELSELAESARKAHDILGSSGLELLDLPDNRMDSLDLLDVVKIIEERIERYKPEVIYTHHCGDLNIDHRVCHNAVVTACRPQPGHCVKELVFFEVSSGTDYQTPGSAPYFEPNYFIDISSVLKKKLDALEAYSSEMREFPHTRSVKALNSLAEVRGASVGMAAAEAFVIGRKLLSLE